MMLADENVFRLDYSPEAAVLQRRAPLSMIYAGQSAAEGEGEHDGRGLLLAIVMCMACWGVLGFFLLN